MKIIGATERLPLDTIRIDDWPTARDRACRIGGPKLSDHELGWLISTGIGTWISKHAEQATARGFDLSVVGEAIRDTGTMPQAWDGGAVVTILPDLAEPGQGGNGGTRRGRDAHATATRAQRRYWALR